MCGIAGFVNLDGAPADERVLHAMAALIRHRGPDDYGSCRVSLRGGVIDTALAFHRLSILDTSERGHQPMMSQDGQVVLLFNGAIYNAPDLTRGLASSYPFRSHTDTEVILALYEQYGIGMLDRIEGMFALAIADLRRGALHLVRDRLGIKPMYWTRSGDALLFASEAKAFLAHPGFVAEIDPAHVDEALAFRFVAGEESLLKGVRHLRPGHRLTITAGGIIDTCYWTIPDRVEPDTRSQADAVSELDSLLTASVRAQLMSDVPVGCQLSGGIDSSLVAMRAGSSVPAYSIVTTDARFSEQPWIRLAADRVGANVRAVPFDEAAFVDHLDAATWHMDQPISVPNSVALWWLSRHVRDQARVLLSGEGADELFGGYRRFAVATATSEGVVRAAQFHSEARLARLRPGANLSAALARRLALCDEGAGDDLANRIRYEMRTHLVDLLLRQDKMMMAHGIENRVPFLGERVVAFARALLPAYLVNGTQAVTKAIVKDLARRQFDEAFVTRRKAGFNLPLAQYFRSPHFTALMEDRLLPGMARRGIVDVDVVRRWWRRALSAPATTEGFWIPVAFELWAQQFVDDATAWASRAREWSGRETLQSAADR